jgi:RNA polymerase sigma-70 factor (ECF subfamily)
VAVPSRAEAAPVLAEVAAPPRPDTSGEGDLPDGFERLYAEHFDFVWRSLRRLGVKAEDLDDAAQDVFIVFLRRRAEFRGQSSQRTWLFGIATNVTHEYRRKQQRAERAAPVTDERQVHSPSPFEQASSSEELRRVDAFLASLDENQRAVFILAELEQMSAPEIAAALNVKLNTVYSRLRLARQAFMASLSPTREVP